MTKKNKVLSEIQTKKNIVEKECASFVRSVKKPVYNKDGSVKKKGDKFCYEVYKNECIFGHPCLVMEDKDCPYFDEKMVNGYLEIYEKEKKRKNE